MNAFGYLIGTWLKLMFAGAASSSFAHARVCINAGYLNKTMEIKRVYHRYQAAEKLQTSAVGTLYKCVHVL